MPCLEDMILPFLFLLLLGGLGVWLFVTEYDAIRRRTRQRGSVRERTAPQSSERRRAIGNVLWSVGEPEPQSWQKPQFRQKLVRLIEAIRSQV
jgi:hypothetical protein